MIRKFGLHAWWAAPIALIAAVLIARTVSMPAQSRFFIEEATIADLHNAIMSGQASCQSIVRSYIERAKAYNGTCTALVTKDGAPIPPAKGTVRAGAPLTFPTQTVPASSIFPNFSDYAGLPFEFGRMESTVSDPTVQQQFGMRVGIPNASQLNALETLNIRGERSVTCKGDFDRAPSAGPLPPGAPAVCEEFRKQPDALERAAELDRQYGSKPDLQQLPMYCAVFSIKNWYDAKDMRATGGNDVAFAMDAPKTDSTDVATLRKKGAIVYAVATANSIGGVRWSLSGEQRQATALGLPGPGTAPSVLPEGNVGYGVWGGQPCNPYDTERVPRGTSSGSAVSVAANLVTCSICEQTSASCKGPASRNNVVSLLATKGVMMDGGTSFVNAGDRAGIQCRTVKDAVSVLDAVKGYASDDPFRAIPNSLIPSAPYVSFSVLDKDVKAQPLRRMRIGVVREFMVKHTSNDVAISDQIDREIKTVLRDTLGADLVESVDPLYPDDPTIPNMTYTFQDAFAEILPVHAPEYFWQRTASGELEFGVPGWDVTSVGYAVALSRHQAPLSTKLTLRRISGSGLGNPQTLVGMNRYLAKRGDSRVTDWASWVANAKWKSEADRLDAQSAVGAADPRAPAASVSYLKMQAVLRMIVLKVMYENRVDVFVNPEQTTPPYRLGGPGEPPVNDRAIISCCTALSALLGGPEIEVPAGYTQIVYEPRYALAAEKRNYVMLTGDVQTRLSHPMPISLMVWSGPGSDPAVIRVASAFEAATHHRIPPPAFGRLSSER